ncbi:MAG: hypothetical protein H7258_03545 [Ferruginibacter sp.]|nr:hypothetical protein [Ferruginibacter sp.]
MSTIDRLLIFKTSYPIMENNLILRSLKKADNCTSVQGCDPAKLMGQAARVFNSGSIAGYKK